MQQSQAFKAEVNQDEENAALDKYWPAFHLPDVLDQTSAQQVRKYQADQLKRFENFQ
jgi:hypothetical protein